MLQSSVAEPCSCNEDRSPFEQQIRSAFQVADYIALVEISSTTTVVVTREESWVGVNTDTGQYEDTIRLVDKPLLLAQFNPLRVWKGDRSATILETAVDPEACGLSFESGSQYLVYAYGPDDEGRIETGRCTRTALAGESSRDIAVLEALIKPAPATAQHPASEKRFRDALGLIHSYSGSGDELSRAMNDAQSLSQSDPASGYSQTLLAEMLSTWELGQDGKPDELRIEIIELADDALRQNPSLAQAHVAKARTYARASMLLEAETEIAKALAMDPQLESAIFQQAEIYRRSGNLARADVWYRNFIAVTETPARKSNGYYWLGKMYQDAAYSLEGQQRDVFLSSARNAYQHMVDLDPQGAWKLVNLAIFLNGYVADFDAAELYAQKALAVMEFPMARYHLAAARYQKLASKVSDLDAMSLQTEIARIAAATQVSLEQAIAFRGFSTVIVSRLSDLQSRSIN